MCRLSDLDGEPCFLGRLGGNASSSGSSDSVLELLGRNLRYVVRFVARFRFELGAAPELSCLCAAGARFRFGLGAAPELSCLCAAGARFRFELGAAPELSELSLSELSTPMSLLSELSLSELRICGL